MNKMKKWICSILCLSMIAGLASIEAKASKETGTDEDQIQIMTAQAPVTETAAVETSKTEVPLPSLPVFIGNYTVKDENAFQTALNVADKTWTITGYVGNRSATTIYIPEKINGFKVTAVADKVFEGCPYLKHVVFMTDVEIQGSSLFFQGHRGTNISYAAARPEIWGKANGKTATFAAGAGLVFHPLDGSAQVSSKKAAGLTKATITWSAVNGAASYHVYRKSGKGQFALRGSISAGLSFTDTGLKAGITYKYKVIPVFAASDGETIEGYASKEVSVAMVPAKLKGVRAKGVRGGVQVKWKRNKNVSGYQVYMKVHVKGFKTKFNRVKTIKKNKITGYRYKMAVRGMKYSFKVRSFKNIKGKKIFGPYVTVSAKAK